ncbi:MAG: hypothetical protein QOE64_675, partial [Frankiales bacterium]|nr:hypothetical protein [Frankiales bacterium]
NLKRLPRQLGAGVSTPGAKCQRSSPYARFGRNRTTSR